MTTAFSVVVKTYLLDNCSSVQVNVVNKNATIIGKFGRQKIDVHVVIYGAT